MQITAQKLQDSIGRQFKKKYGLSHITVEVEPDSFPLEGFVVKVKPIELGVRIDFSGKQTTKAAWDATVRITTDSFVEKADRVIHDAIAKDGEPCPRCLEAISGLCQRGPTHIETVKAMIDYYGEIERGEIPR